MCLVQSALRLRNQPVAASLGIRNQFPGLFFGLHEFSVFAVQKISGIILLLCQRKYLRTPGDKPIRTLYGSFRFWFLTYRIESFMPTQLPRHGSILCRRPATTARPAELLSFLKVAHSLASIPRALRQWNCVHRSIVLAQ